MNKPVPHASHASKPAFPRRSRMDAQTSVFIQRFHFRSAAARTPTAGGGILSVTTFRPGIKPLVLMVDLQGLNDGSSLTNAADAAVHHVAHTAFPPLGADHRSATWVELDSDGNFDLMHPLWPMEKPLQGPQMNYPSVSWQPVRHDGMTRTLQAFLAKFPELGGIVWDEAAVVLKSLQPKAPPRLAKE